MTNWEVTQFRNHSGSSLTHSGTGNTSGSLSSDGRKRPAGTQQATTWGSKQGALEPGGRKANEARTVLAAEAIREGGGEKGQPRVQGLCGHGERVHRGRHTAQGSAWLALGTKGQSHGGRKSKDQAGLAKGVSCSECLWVFIHEHKNRLPEVPAVPLCTGQALGGVFCIDSGLRIVLTNTAALFSTHIANNLKTITLQ